MCHLELVTIKLPADEQFSFRFFDVLSECGKQSRGTYSANRTNVDFLPLINIEFSNVQIPEISFSCNDFEISKTITNETGQLRLSPHSYKHLTIDEFANRLKDTGSIKTIDHLGVNFPWFDGISPVLIDLRQQLKSKTAYYRFPSGEGWDFILPATKSELKTNNVDLSIERRPKLELVSFEKSSTPIIQIDCITTIEYARLKEIFPEAIFVDELSNVWVYINNNFGVDICFVLNGPSNSDWSTYFEGFRL